MLVLPLVFVAVLVWYLLILWKWKKNVFDVLEKLPGLKWYPIVGTFSTFIEETRENVLQKFAEVCVTHGPLYRSWNGSVPEVHLAKADHIQIVLRSSAHVTKGPFYKNLYPWLGEGLFISEGAKWFYQRKMLTPSFHFKVLDSFVQTFAEKTTHLAKMLESKADGEYFNAVPEIAKCTLKIFVDAAMGIDLDNITNNPLEYVKNVYEFTEMAMWRYWHPHIKDPVFNLMQEGQRYNKALKYLHKFGNDTIAYKKEMRRQTYAKIENGGIKQNRQSFLDLVMDATENKAEMMSDYDLKSLVSTLLVAGYETTANTTSWALFLLGNHPEIQEKVLEEARSVLKGRDAPTTMSDLSELKYLECVVKETLRLYPVLPFLTRKITEDITIDGYKIPADTQAIVHIFLSQRDPEQYPEPNKFDPERFTPENAKNRHPFAYIPFSAGPRNCLGMRFALLELKAVLATIINKYKVTSLQTEEEVKLFAHVLLRSQSGINVKLERRVE